MIMDSYPHAPQFMRAAHDNYDPSLRSLNSLPFLAHGLIGWDLAMGGPGFAHYFSSDISDVLGVGGIVDPRSGSAVGSSQRHVDGAKKVRDSYEAFCRTKAGSYMVSDHGKADWDGYAMLDLGDRALAATITYGDGRRILAWNSKYMDRIDAGLMAGPDLERAIISNMERYGHVFGNPMADDTVARAADFYEAMAHEPGHYRHLGDIFRRSSAEEEYATYSEVADFYEGLASRTMDSSYAMGKFYEAIAQRSRYKAEQFKGRIGRLDDGHPVEESGLEAAIAGEEGCSSAGSD